MRDMRNTTIVVAVTLAIAVTAACGKKKPATGPQPPPAEEAAVVPPTPPPPAERVEDKVPVAAGNPDDSITNKSLDDLNRDSPLKPVFFRLDSAELDESGRSIASANAQVLKKYGTWGITIEGHCDERGTAEYNLALGDRRASAVRDYLVSRGVTADRLRTISYGEERPKYDNSREETRRLNRRAALTVNVR